MMSLYLFKATANLTIKMEQTELNSLRIGNRVYRYLYEKRARRADAQDLICRLSQSLPETVVFGGMIRDFSLGLAREFNSDIDLVSMADSASILSKIQQYNPEKNKFGGFRFVVGRQLFDIWSFQETWAFKEGLVKATTIADLCATTFFNVDAAYQPLKSKNIFSSNNYFKTVTNRSLDINLEENPAPDKVAARAIHMTICRDMHISPRLQLFILKNVNNTLWKRELTGSFLKLMARNLENHDDKSFSFYPQTDMF